MYEKQLRSAGFTEKQAEIYLACLELGLAQAPQIARKAGIKRTTAYGILDELVRMGVVSVVEKRGRKAFHAQDPCTLLNIMEERMKEVEDIVPSLRELYATSHIRPRVEFFEGTQGVRRILEDSLGCNEKKVRQIIRVQDWIDVFGKKVTKWYIHARIKARITAYALHPSSGDIYSDSYGRQDASLRRYVRYVPPSLFSTSLIMIYDKKVAMISTRKENFGFIIESKEFSHTLRNFFEFMWQMGSREPQKGY